MPLWGKNDFANNSPKSAVMQLDRPVNTANIAELFGNTTNAVYGTRGAVGVFGVSAGEVSAARQAGEARPAHAGWNLRTVGTGGRAGRVTYETLVAMKNIVNDAEDTIFEDYTLVIDTQPSSVSSNTNSALNLIVGARSVPAGATLVYSWQIAQANGVWMPVTTAGIFSQANTANLAVSNNATINAAVFRVIVQATGADNVTSANATVIAL